MENGGTDRNRGASALLPQSAFVFIVLAENTQSHTLNPSQRHKIGMDVKSKPFKATKPSPEKSASEEGIGTP